MKLFLSLFLGIAFFSACQKDLTTSQTANGTKLVNKIGRKTDSYYFSILTPITGSPGVYSTSFNGTAFQLTGLTYDDVDYSSTEDGVPAMGTLSPVAQDATITQNYLQGGGSYYVYTLTTNIIADSVNSALDNFDKAFYTWFTSSSSPNIATVPLFSTYVKNYYTSVSGVKVTTNGCKLIRRYLNAQSYYALAETDYPQAVVTPQTSTTPTINGCNVLINGEYYDLWLSTGTSGNITSIKDSYFSSGSSTVNITGWTITGTYKSLNKTAQTVNVTFTIYEPGTNSNVTYSGIANLGFQ